MECFLSGIFSESVKSSEEKHYKILSNEKIKQSRKGKLLLMVYFLTFFLGIK